MKPYETTDYTTVDRMVHAWQGRLTASVSPATVMLAYLDWLAHLANSPGKQLQLMEDFLHQSMRFGSYALQATVHRDCPSCVEPSPQDKRFNGEKWRHWPYNLFQRSFLSAEGWRQRATTGVSGVSAHHQTVVAFGAHVNYLIFLRLPTLSVLILMFGSVPWNRAGLIC